jgi:serine/threonine protein kinase
MSKEKEKEKGKSNKLNPGSPTEPSPFGPYYLLGLIARGGMAEVHRARLRELRGQPELLAIKVMRPELAREARFVDMFHREGQLAVLLQNRSIVRTLEVGRIEGRHYIAMEYIGGRDLTQVLRRCQKSNLRIPVPHAVYIAARIAEGLDFAHRLVSPDGRQLNIVNRDVSPSNVRLAYNGDVKLLDFGIAQALMKFTSEIGVLKGKFSYMSPEQIRGMPVDARTDVFSTGIILHEMLTTEKLFRGDTEFALMEKVRKAEVDPPSKFNRRVTPELDAIVLRALARDVADRYQSAAELHRDLARLLEGYRFDPRELREFMRKEFRREFLKEEEEAQQALTSTPDGPRPVESDEPEPITAVSRRRMAATTADVVVPPAPSTLGTPSHRAATPMFDPGGLGGGGLPTQSAGHITAPPPLRGGTGTAQEVRDNGQGFWSRLFRKKRRTEPPGEG